MAWPSFLLSCLLALCLPRLTISLQQWLFEFVRLWRSRTLPVEEESTEKRRDSQKREIRGREIINFTMFIQMPQLRSIQALLSQVHKLVIQKLVHKQALLSQDHKLATSSFFVTKAHYLGDIRLSARTVTCLWVIWFSSQKNNYLWKILAPQKNSSQKILLL